MSGIVLLAGGLYHTLMRFSDSKLLLTAALLAGEILLVAPTVQALDLSMDAAFLGEPDIFVPGLELDAELSITPSFGIFMGGAYFLSGTWDLETGLRWHLSPQLALSLQALFLFDVLDGFVPQLGAEVRWSFPLTSTGSWRFFNEVGLYVPLKERFVQPFYGAGISLRF